MKKILAISIIITLTAAFSGCVGDATPTTPGDGETAPAPAEQPPAKTSPERAIDEHEEDEEEHRGELAPEEMHKFLNNALDAIKRSGDVDAAIHEMEEARQVMTDAEVIEMIDHIIEELEAGNMQGAVHEMEDWLGPDEHEEDEGEHSSMLAPEEIHEFLSNALNAVKGSGDVGAAMHEMEEARQAMTDAEVIEMIDHIIEELEAGNLQDAMHEMEDWLGEDAH
jgi:urease gamma subunit